MTPTAEIKEVKWRNFHEGQGSVIRRASNSGKSFLTFLTPSGERFETWKKAQAYMRGEEVEAETEDGQTTKRLSSKNASKSIKRSKSSLERREFRELYWKKKGGQVKKREYLDKNGSNRRWEVKYVSPSGEETFRSWKQCVKFLGHDPQPSATKCTRTKRGDGTTTVMREIFPPGSVPKKMRGRTTPSPTSKAGPSASSFATSSGYQTRASAIAGPLILQEPQLAETSNGGFLNGGESRLEDSGNGKTRNLVRRQGDLGVAAEDQSWCADLRSKCSDKELLVQNEDKDQKSLEKPEELQSADGAVEKTEVDPESSFMEQNKKDNSSFEKKKALSSGINERRPRKRLLNLQSTTDDTNEARESDTNPIETSKDEEPLEEHRHEQTSVRTSKRSPPEDTSKVQELLAKHHHLRKSVRMSKPSSGDCIRSRKSSLRENPLENGIHSSDVEHQKHDKNPSRKNVVTSCNESIGGREDQEMSSMASVNDDTLHQALISLLYADHIRQPSKHTNSSPMIGTLYAEYIERNFYRNQSSILPLAMEREEKNRKGGDKTVKMDKKVQKTTNTHSKQNNPEPDRKAKTVNKKARVDKET